jgi:N-acetylmuramic acid 6-phosphate (MurNAc-6-P) etherase
MGEAKRRKSQREMIDEAAATFARQLADEGRLIEVGWAAFRRFAVSKDAPELQVSEMQMAFMAGAEHLFSSITSMLDSDAETTAADLRRMDLIERELDAWRAVIEERLSPTQGRA